MLNYFGILIDITEEHILNIPVDAHAVRWLGNQLAIIQNIRKLTNIKPANAP